MTTAAQVIDLATRRVRWLEGKNAELRADFAAIQSETDWATRSWGARPQGLVESLLYGGVSLLQFASPTVQRWDGLDRRLAEAYGPNVANVRRAIASLAELRPRFEGVVRTANPEELQQLQHLTGRIDTALSEGRRLYNQWINSPISRFDTENTTMSERLFRQFSFERTPIGYAVRQAGGTGHQAWEVTGQPVEEWSRAEEEEIRQRSVFGQQPAGAGVKAGETPQSGRAGLEQTGRQIRDYLAIGGVVSLGLLALYLGLKVKRAIPFV